MTVRQLLRSSEISYQHPAGDEVVGSAALAGADPGHVPHLQYEAAQHPAARGQQVRHSEAEDEARELTVTEPRPPEQDDGGGGEVGDQSQAQQDGERQDVLVLVRPQLQLQLCLRGEGVAGGGGEDHLLALTLSLCHAL